MNWNSSYNHDYIIYSDMVSTGGYYMRVSGLMTGKDTNAIQSPTYTYENVSCVEFYYYMTGKHECYQGNTVECSYNK